MKLTIIRHGQAQSNLEGRIGGHFDFPLTPLGETQASKVGEKLEGESFDAIYVSDLQRAKKTAEIITGYHKGLEMTALSSLRERDVKRFSGVLVEDIRKEFSIPEGISIGHRLEQLGLVEGEEEMLGRVKPFIDMILQKHQKDSILLVNHARLINIIIGYLTQGSLGYKKIDNCSISVFEGSSLPLELVLYNDTSHLAH